MTEPANVTAQQIAQMIRTRTRVEAAVVGLRVVASVAHRFGLAHELGLTLPAAEAETPRDELLPALNFAVAFAAEVGVNWANLDEWQTERLQMREPDDLHPISRLARVASEPEWGALIVDLALLASLPELHEGYAALCRLLHPAGEPYPTVTLALHWQEFEARSGGMAVDVFTVRDAVEDLLVHSRLAQLGLVRLAGDGPWHGRTLRPGPGVLEALLAHTPQLDGAVLLAGVRAVPGLELWLAQPEVQRAIAVLQRGEPCLLALVGGSAGMRATRVRALLGAAGCTAIYARLALADKPAERERAMVDAYCAAFVHRALPWLDLQPGDGAEPDWGRAPGQRLQWDLPVLVTAQVERELPDLRLPLLALPVHPLPATARRALWASLLPQLAEHAGLLAASYPIDPDEALDVATDLALRQQVEGRALELADIGVCLRARTAWHARPGVTRVIPRAGWAQLRLPEASAVQLREGVRRVHQQMTVLDDWGFEQGRLERRGLRMLFYGPPGTGKTLAAEAMARALGVDLLVVDIASLVSKWIGETEKNLAAVFDLAEKARALLLFDEADALFGQRTEGNDAHDRYANLETAFLLQRLERYEGVTILTTNLRTSMDAAFTRRFEFIVEFPEPDAATRAALWQLHLPAAAPLAADVDLAELADWYAITGAQIKNAALAAAFLAAADGSRMHQQHFLLAIEREYDKAGKAHPGYPPVRSASTFNTPDVADLAAAGHSA